MDAKDVIGQVLGLSRQVTLEYLSDFSDAELLVRPVPGANHGAWQLGHLALSEAELLQALGRSHPDLPPGFAEVHRPENAGCDDPQKFCSKQAYLEILEGVRKATLELLDGLSDADLESPAPEPVRSYAPTLMAALTLMGVHELMHAGQLVAVRRKLGKPIRI